MGIAKKNNAQVYTSIMASLLAVSDSELMNVKVIFKEL